jgi:hypothetical protein
MRGMEKKRQAASLLIGLQLLSVGVTRQSWTKNSQMATQFVQMY